LGTTIVIKTDLYTEFGSLTIETSFKGTADFCPLVKNIGNFDDILF